MACVFGLYNPKKFDGKWIMTTLSPTSDTYSALLYTYDYFNKTLFDSELPAVVFTYHRQNRVMGYASFKRWVSDKEELIDELAINPEYFAKYPLIEICQTLVHEMVHIWQSKFGTPGRRGYHNKEWGNKMKSIGLIPSSTGKPGGDETGEQMMDYVLVNGPFISACQSLIKLGFKFPLLDRYPIFREETPILAYNEDGEKFTLRKDFVPMLAKQEKMEAMRSDSSEVQVQNIEPKNDSDYSQFQSFQPSPQTTKPRPKSGRVRYICSGCQSLLWAKSGLNIGCLDCNKKFREDE
tara:strand:- start:3385 stop:4266 length:882 start_codon:yes stop_codon:yes gene_type:complete